METVDIIREVVEAISIEFTAKTITENANGTYTLTTDDTLHLQEGFSITIGAVTYEILTVVKDALITINGISLPTIKVFNIYPPVYYHGTVRKVKAEIKGATTAQNVFARTPFIYLREIIEDNVNTKYANSTIEKTTDLQILFLTQCNYADWKIVDHYSKSIGPMRNLVENFVDKLYKNKMIGRFENYRAKPHVNFGVYVTDKGETKSIFTDNLSGIEMNITLPFKRQTPTCKI
jgi:hypothetical protein